MIPLIFPKVPQSFLGILRVPQSPPPLEPPPLRTLQYIPDDSNSIFRHKDFLKIGLSPKRKNCWALHFWKKNFLANFSLGSIPKRRPLLMSRIGILYPL